MLSERSQSALNDLLHTWSWASPSCGSVPVENPRRSEAEVFDELVAEGEEDIAIWLCDEQNLPAAMAEEVVAAFRRAKGPASLR